MYGYRGLWWYSWSPLVRPRLWAFTVLEDLWLTGTELRMMGLDYLRINSHWKNTRGQLFYWSIFPSEQEPGMFLHIYYVAYFIQYIFNYRVSFIRRYSGSLFKTVGLLVIYKHQLAWLATECSDLNSFFPRYTVVTGSASSRQPWINRITALWGT